MTYRHIDQLGWPELRPM